MNPIFHIDLKGKRYWPKPCSRFQQFLDKIFVLPMNTGVAIDDFFFKNKNMILRLLGGKKYYMKSIYTIMELLF